MALRITYWGRDSNSMDWLDDPFCGHQSCNSSKNAGAAAIRNIRITSNGFPLQPPTPPPTQPPTQPPVLPPVVPVPPVWPTVTPLPQLTYQPVQPTLTQDPVMFQP